MAVTPLKNMENLDQTDKEKVAYFIRLLLNQTKYRALQQEIDHRREEIQHGDTLSHDAIWDQVHV